MRKLFALLLLTAALPSLADTIITREGASYSGQFASSKDEVTFTDSAGINYNFPRRDVQSLVFTDSADIVTLRSGKTYSGKFTGSNPLSFTDNQGIQYQFPAKDVASLVLSENAPASLPAEAKTIPAGSEIDIRTSEKIDSQVAPAGTTFSAQVTNDVLDVAGGVAIPAGSPARLLILNASRGAVGSPDLVLDLDTVTIKGRVHRVYSSELKESNRKGLGANKRTAEMLGGGAAIGSLMGAIFGGGRGAGIGVAAGAGGGFLTQLLTRGKQVTVPAETELHFRLEKALILHPGQ
jgi:hypothetical protein